MGSIEARRAFRWGKTDFAKHVQSLTLLSLVIAKTIKWINHE